MTKFIFRILLSFTGIFLLYLSAKPIYEMLSYRITGEKVTGRIIGFSGGRNGKTILTENSGIRNGNRKARKPFFKYPIIDGSLDSLQARSSTGLLFSFANFDINENVTVVFPKNHPDKAYIFSYGIIFSELTMALLSIFMLLIGITGRLG